MLGLRASHRAQPAVRLVQYPRGPGEVHRPAIQVEELAVSRRPRTACRRLGDVALDPHRHRTPVLLRDLHFGLEGDEHARDLGSQDGGNVVQH